MGELVDATEKAIAAATHLTSADDGAVQALRMLARKIDAWDIIVGWAIDDVSHREGGRPTVPANDNVSIPSYLKYAESLGLTPAGRKSLPKPEEEKPGGKLRQLRSVPRPKAS